VCSAHINVASYKSAWTATHLNHLMTTQVLLVQSSKVVQLSMVNNEKAANMAEHVHVHTVVRNLSCVC
jgi:diadenosine tetraphosphate (Ap4A) HIT family hydrolase